MSLKSYKEIILAGTSKNWLSRRLRSDLQLAAGSADKLYPLPVGVSLIMTPIIGPISEVKNPAFLIVSVLLPTDTNTLGVCWSNALCGWHSL